MELIALLLLLGFGLGLALLLDGSDGGTPAAAAPDPVPPEGEVFRGTDGDDLILGTDGPDRIFGNAGDDTLLGGPGDDSIFGGDGDDRLFAGPGNDLLRGGAGNDFLYSFAGQDTLFGDTGDDFLIALDGPDRPGAPDQLFGGFGNDTLVGDDGDTLTGGAGTDIFAVLAYDGTEAPVVITDFDARRDTLEIAVEDTTFPPATEDDFTFIIDGPQGHVRVDLAGHTLAILENTTEVPENVFFFRDDLLGLIEEYRALEARETAAARAAAQAAAAQGAVRAAPA